MSLIEKIMKVFFGDKSAKDIKAIRPYIDRALSYGESLKSISNDQLRAKTTEFRTRIKEAVEALEAEIATLQSQADVENQKAVGDTSGEGASNQDEKTRLKNLENIFSRIDELKKEVHRVTEETLKEILPEAFAVVKETARRFATNETLEVTATPFDRELSGTHPNVTLDGEKALWATSWDAAGTAVRWDMVHYDVQLIGGVVLHEGKIAEMATGEGKTLVATLPIYLNALPGKGVHVVTVNNYLARRDAAWMGPLFQFHGLSVDCIDNTTPNSPERKKAYLADITYGTNSEFGFDYLRDNGARDAEELVQREHNYAIVDEVDSVLIDDARTPLIISGEMVGGDNSEEFVALRPQVEMIVAEQKRFIQKEFVEAKRLLSEGDNSYTDDGEGGGAKLYRVFRGAPKTTALIKFLSEGNNKLLLQTVEAKYMELGNRLMPAIDKDLYFTIDERINTIQLTDRGVALLSKYNNDENYFILPDLSVDIEAIKNDESLSAEEKDAAREALYRDFSVKSQRLHILTQMLKAYMLFEKDVQYVIINNEVKIVDVQTGRIMEGRRYSDGLHQALEAKENVKIEKATQTYATITLQNYFRMYKKLAGMTGTAMTEANEFWEIYKLDVVEIPTNRPIARVDQADMLFRTKREKYNAIEREIARLHEEGRPVLVGTTSVEVSELISRRLSMRKIEHNVLNAKLHMQEAEIVARAGKPGVVTIATNMAGRGTDIKLTQEVKDKGGLAIIGTERHDSRRVDRQLRGRAGRQGDPGTSQFYISLEDNLMRLFASERLGKIMAFLGLKDGDVIQDKRITNMVEKAQKRVEENHFGSRKHTLEYDNVMNSQRQVVYARRRHALFGDRLSVDISNMMSDACYVIVNEEKNGGSYDEFRRRVLEAFAVECPISEEDFTAGSVEALSSRMVDAMYVVLKEKMERVVKDVYPFIKNVYEAPDNHYRMIGVPFSDGIKTLHMGVDLEKAYNTAGHQVALDLQKNIVLSITDDAWKQHLKDMDDLRETVRNAVYEQKDPVLIYKFEAYELFQAMINRVNLSVISFLMKGRLPIQDPSRVEQVRKAKRAVGRESRGVEEGAQQGMPNVQQEVERPRTYVRESPKYGRNDRVKVQNINTGEVKEMKYKQAEPLVEAGTWVVTGKA
ncbi:MAG: preprotein translocase subunit SecA [Flavobacteriales bacterium]|nr:preprotein translocase subunit SecA [Flavobacteriales bacterium]